MKTKTYVLTLAKFKKLSPKTKEFLSYKTLLEHITKGLKTPTTLPPLRERRKIGQLIYSIKMAKFVKQYEPVLTHAFDLIRNVKNIDGFKGNRWLMNRKTGTHIRIKTSKPTYERDPDGVEVYSSFGDFLILPFKGMDARFIIRGAQLANKYLKQKGYKVEGFDAMVAEPHIFYDASFDRSYFVTNFYEGTIERFEIAKHWDLVKPISTLKEHLGKQGIKVEPRNILIRLPRSQFGKKTIWLWDLLA